MADAARNITIKVLLDEAKARAGLKRMGDDAEQSGSRWSKMGAAAKAGIALAGAALVSFAVDAVKAAAADEAAQRQLALALENTTGATEGQVDAVEDYISATSKATGITDDELRPALANLVRATGDVEEAQAADGYSYGYCYCPWSPPRTGHPRHFESGSGECGSPRTDGYCCP